MSPVMPRPHKALRNFAASGQRALCWSLVTPGCALQAASPSRPSRQDHAGKAAKEQILSQLSRVKRDNGHVAAGSGSIPSLNTAASPDDVIMLRIYETSKNRSSTWDPKPSDNGLGASLPEKSR